METDGKQVLGPHAEAAQAARKERAAQALRDNLRRRKAQARGRAEAGEGPDAADAAPQAQAPRDGETR